MQLAKLFVFASALSFQILHFILGGFAFAGPFVLQLVELYFFVFGESFKFRVDEDFTPFDFLDFGLQLLYRLLRLLHLFNDGLVTFMACLEVPFMSTFLGLPFLVHFAFNLFFLLLKLLLSVFSDQLLPVGVLVPDALQLRVNLFAFALVLLQQSCPQLFFSLLLLFVEPLALLPHRLADALLNIALSFSDQILLLTDCRFLGVLKLVISSGSLCYFSQAVSLKFGSSLFLDTLLRLLQVLFLLAFDLVYLTTMFGFQIDFLIFQLVSA